MYESMFFAPLRDEHCKTNHLRKETRRIHDKKKIGFGEIFWSFWMHVRLHAIKMHIQQEI